jgi:hypothetical protein
MLVEIDEECQHALVAARSKRVEVWTIFLARRVPQDLQRFAIGCRSIAGLCNAAVERMDRRVFRHEWESCSVRCPDRFGDQPAGRRINNGRRFEARPRCLDQKGAFRFREKAGEQQDVQRLRKDARCEIADRLAVRVENQRCWANSRSNWR